jgi:hypothetical protein
MNTPRLRSVPYPYKAAIAITSDIDCTDSIEKYLAIHHFMDKKVGIPYSNTFFPYHDEKKFSLFSAGQKEKELIVEHIRRGYIEAIHSFGEIEFFERENAYNAIKFLAQNNCYLKMWIDHADAASNLCKYRYNGKGDLKKEKEYHLDLLLEYGIRYVWTERLTNIIGQEKPLKFSHLLQMIDRRKTIKSLKEMCKTAGKIVLSFCGYPKYNYFARNQLFYTAKMKDDNYIYEFVRFNNHYSGAAVGDTFEDLWYLISERTIKKLMHNGGFSIVYTHLGKRFGLESEHGKKTVEALKNLKRYSDKKEVLILTAKNLLDYAVRLKSLNWFYDFKNEELEIHIDSIDDALNGSYLPSPKDLNGITFYTDQKANVLLNQKKLDVTYNSADHTGIRSITISCP